MVKSATFEPKKAIGIGLRPSLWERIDRFAESKGKSRNAVIEELLTLYIPVVEDFRISGVSVMKSHSREEIEEMVDA